MFFQSEKILFQSENRCYAFPDASRGDAMANPQNAFDAIVIGAGIAGASVASELSADCRVLLLERETQPGYHTTGRSAAVYTTSYGPPVIRALTRASGGFFNDPASPFLPHPLVHPRDVIFVAREDQQDTLASLRDELGDAVVAMSSVEISDKAPLLRHGYVAAALLDQSAADIDVSAMHQHYLRSFSARGGLLRTGAELRALTRTSTGWDAETSGGRFHAPVVINAAGAWADEVGRIAGLDPVGLIPKRRTVLIVAPPDPPAPAHWPMIVDADEQFYLKPDAGKLLISPADATPSPPCDAQPDEMDVAQCVDRVERAFDLNIRRIENKWAGLRSFLPDGDPLAAYDPDAPGFFWLAGQGGYGIQTAPALARVAAALVREQPIPDDIAAHGVDASALARQRPGLAA